MTHKATTTLLALLASLAFSIPLWAATPVNINTADAATIASSLDGIGTSKAEAIVAYREAHGPFKKAADITNVKGIGEATVTRNGDAIRVSDDKTAPQASTASTPKS